MKTIIKESLENLIKDRYLLAILITLLLLAIISAIAIGFSIHPSDRQLVSHYSAFGITNFYKDQWFYGFTFVLFQLTAATLHVVLSIKLLMTKGRSLAVAFAWLGIIIILIGWITAASILGLPL